MVITINQTGKKAGSLKSNERYSGIPKKG
jgi:hypothetical protein